MIRCIKIANSVNIVLTMNINYTELLKQYREQMFLSQRDLADELGVSYVTVNRWETGKFDPTIKMKKRLYGLFKKAKLIK